MIQSFAYRRPRLSATLPVELLLDSGTLSGLSHDVSEQGLSACWGEPVLPGTVGRLRFRIGHCQVELAASVTHAEGYTTGLAFAFASEQERAFVRALLQALAPTAPA